MKQTDISAWQRRLFALHGATKLPFSVLRDLLGELLLCAEILKSGIWYPLRRWPTILVLVFFEVLIAGCAPPSIQPQELGTLSDTLSNSKTGKPSMVPLNHDFGIVRPGSRSLHQFRIRNSSDSQWTVQTVVKTCRCTATMLSSKTVPAGEDLLVDVQYRAPTQEGSDARSVEVHFQESDVPVFQLGTRALIRHPLYLTEKELRIESDQEQGTITLVAANYSDSNWSQLRASTQASWLSVEADPVDDERVSTARQAWRVTIAADTTKLPAGDDRAVVLFVPEGAAKEESQQAIVTVLRRPAIRVIPSRIFLGTVTPGERVERRVLLQLSETSIRQFGVIDPNQLSVTSGFKGKLTHTAEAVRDKIVALNLTLVAPELSSVVDETITVQLGGVWPPVEIPLLALVEASP